QAKLANLMLDQALAGSELAAKAALAKRVQDVVYLSPEQTEAGAFVDGLSDLYSLGAVLYARLTGRPPFQAATVDETRHPIRTGTPTRLRRLNPTIPDEFEGVVMKLLSRLQEDRYASAAAL